MESRPYQQRIIDDATANWHKGCTSQMIESPCGSGKTLMAFAIANRIYAEASSITGSNNVGFVWTAMRRNLLSQAASENFIHVGCPNVEYVSMFEKDVTRIRDKYDKIVIIIDEGHHDSTDSFSNIVNQLNPKLILGLSATPIRTDRKKLCFQKTIKEAGYHALISNGYLSQYRQWMMPEATPRSFASTYLSNPDKWGKTIMYFRTYEECAETTDILKSHGIKCDIVTGQTDRLTQLDEFENGQLDVLTNMYVLTEGYNFDRLESVFVRDSSKLPTIQMAGRVLRKHYDVPIKNIVQSVKTKYPFTRTAKPAEHLKYEDGRWVSIMQSNAMNIVEKRMMERLINTQVEMPKYISSKTKRSGRHPRV